MPTIAAIARMLYDDRQLAHPFEGSSRCKQPQLHSHIPGYWRKIRSTGIIFGLWLHVLRYSVDVMHERFMIAAEYSQATQYPSPPSQVNLCIYVVPRWKRHQAQRFSRAAQPEVAAAAKR